MDNNLILQENINKPVDLKKSHHLILTQITQSLNVPRDVVPSERDIDYALSNLPRELEIIPQELRDKFIARSCIATSVGLFDAAIIYIWNSVVKKLREKVDAFGLEMIKHIRGNGIEDGFLEKIKDNDLLLLCRQLNIITEQGYYFLDQCRDIRNNASVAHPSSIELNDRELIVFINRCATYGLSDNYDVTGIDFKIFNSVIENPTATDDNLTALADNIKNTFDSQKEFIFSILYSFYIDVNVSESKRNNSLILAKKIQTELSNNIIVNLLNKHNEKKIKGDEASVNNSVFFLRELNLISYLNDSEKINIFSKGINNLRNVHMAMNNFYNEPPFAERLSEISAQIKPAPEVLRGSYTNVLIDCYFGNSYGVSDDALPYYKLMLKNLSPKELEVLFYSLLDTDIKNRIQGITWKKGLLEQLLTNLETSVDSHSTLVNLYNQICKKYSLSISPVVLR